MIATQGALNRLSTFERELGSTRSKDQAKMFRTLEMKSPSAAPKQPKAKQTVKNGGMYGMSVANIARMLPNGSIGAKFHQSGSPATSR